MPYTPIVATLGYVLSADGREVLLVHRNARADDQHLGKYNGLGGKLEADEDVVAGMRREILEEAGIECADLALRGTISWPGFGRLHELPMWEGDRNFLPLVFDADPRAFHGVMPYRDGRMVSWRYSRA